MLCWLSSMLRWINVLQLSVWYLRESRSAFEELFKAWLRLLPTFLDYISYSPSLSERTSGLLPELTIVPRCLRWWQWVLWPVSDCKNQLCPCSLSHRDLFHYYLQDNYISYLSWWMLGYQIFGCFRIFHWITLDPKWILPGIYEFCKICLHTIPDSLSHANAYCCIYHQWYVSRKLLGGKCRWYRVLWSHYDIYDWRRHDRKFGLHSISIHMV